MASVDLALLTGKAGFQKLVALKRPGADVTQEPEVLAMFLDEARLAARLNHPNVVQTYEVGLRDGMPFIAMEFVDGQPLSRMRRVPELPLALHLCIIADVLLGLHHAHELRDFCGTSLQVVHRDVSPQNVLVSYDGVAKLVDFGIAKAHTQLAQTLAGCVKGKIAYMSPEQVVGESLDRRADLFAVGVLLWEACARRRLWPGMSARDRFRLLQAGAIPSLTETDAQLPAALDQICRRALAFSPEDRFRTAAEIEVELQALLAGSELRATRRDVAAFMAQHFQVERAKTRQLIESKLGHLGIESQRAGVGSSAALLSPSKSAPPSPGAVNLPRQDAEVPPPQDIHASLRSTLVLGSTIAQPAASPRRSSSMPPSAPPSSCEGGVRRPSVVHSWGRSAPPPPPLAPTASAKRKPLAVFLLAVVAGSCLVGIGAGTFALGRALEPKRHVGAARAVASPSPVPTPRAARLASPGAPLALAPRVSEPSMSEPSPKPLASALPPRKRPAFKQAPQPTPNAASSQAPPVPSILVTDFGGRR